MLCGHGNPSRPTPRIAGRLHGHLRELAVGYPALEEVTDRIAAGDPVACEAVGDLAVAIERFLAALSSAPERLH
jgi:hypothetical protein